MSIPVVLSDKRRSARARFHEPPTVWVSHENSGYEARCVNVSDGGVALRFGPEFAGAKAGDHLITALVAPRQSVTASGVVVHSHRGADEWQVLVSFSEQPVELRDLIMAALSCTYDEFAAGSASGSGTRASLQGWLFKGLANDIGHIAQTCHIIDMENVREVDPDALAELADAQRRFGIVLSNCNERVARIIHDNFALSMCAGDCRVCAAEAAALLAQTIH